METVNNGEKIYDLDIVKDGVCWRLSASGYLDATDWNTADNIVQALTDIIDAAEG